MRIARANVDRWMDAQQTVFNRPMGEVFWGLVRTPADKRDMAAIAQAIEETAKACGMIEPRWRSTTSSPGPTSRCATFPGACTPIAGSAWTIERPELPALRAWYDRLCQRPAYQQHIVACPVV